MAFGAEELRVLRRALALALHPHHPTVPPKDAHDCRHLAASLDEATREAARQHAFLLADLARHRAALPATATAYLDLLRDALRTGHRPCRDDLAALGALRGNPTAAALLARCRFPAARTPEDSAPEDSAPEDPAPEERPAPHKPAPGEPAPDKPGPDKPGPVKKPAPAPPGPGGTPRPQRPVPTPGEVFPPKRRPAPPPSGRLAAALVAAG